MRPAESRGRCFPEPDHPYRDCYQRDRDRVVHSTAFRRLEYKTQVFVNHEGDHYRTRLTHTIEVSHIARAMARALGLNEDLAEVVALSHDMGHPPFGHSGEEALAAKLADHGGFNHNRHALRVFDELETRYPDFPGLNLSYEVREAAAKHGAPGGAPWLAEFRADEALPFEAHVADLSDSIAYDSHDVEDALNAELVREEDFFGLRLWERAVARIDGFHRLDAGVRRYQMKRHVIDLLITDAIEHSRARIAAAGVASVADVRACRERLVGNGPELAAEKREFEQFLRTRVYAHYRVVRMAKKARRFIEDLFRVFVEDPGQLPDAFRDRVPVEGPHPVVRDYIAGMTDRFALDEWKRLFQPYERV